MEQKKIIFSGMQPSGEPTLGNYLGAIKNWTILQKSYSSIYCIVDMHAITVKQDPKKLSSQSRQLAMLYLACGLDPKENIIYYQSTVSAHAELAWILNCFCYMGELGRMTQFKEKSIKQDKNINLGLFGYPVLMASDILLFQTDLVPVGKDQKQHLELCRDIATRFNGIYGDTFNLPEPYINSSSSKIMSLQMPTKKMSKSDTQNSFISLLDSPEVILNKVKKAITDSDNKVIFDENKAGIANLINIYSTITKKTIQDIELEFEGEGYGKFKSTVAEAIIEELRPIQYNFSELQKDEIYIDKLLNENTYKANEIALLTLNNVKKKIGYNI